MMSFSTRITSQLAPTELREAYAEVVQREINAKDPHVGAPILYEDEPERGEFRFTFSSQKSS